MNWNYISGFFDADGSITAVANRKGKNKTIQISFHNTQVNILEDIKEFIFEDIGVKGTISVKPAKKENHSTSYDLKYVYAKGLKVANKMSLVHLKKIHRIEVYNKIQLKTKRNGKYTEKEQQERDDLIIEFFKDVL